MSITLTFAGSPDAGGLPAEFIITEGSDYITTESGDKLTTEDN
jgi:hypothetical protein